MATDSALSVGNGKPAGPRRTLSKDTHKPAADDEEAVTLKENARPAIGKLSQWHTERPKPSTKHSILNTGIRRPATNLSAVKDVVWPRSIDNEDSASSSSDSSDFEDDAHKTQSSGTKLHSLQRRKGSRGSYSKFNVGNDEYNSRGRVAKKDGRLNISVNETHNRGYLAKALGASFIKNVGPGPSKQTKDCPAVHKDEGREYPTSASPTVTSPIPRPKLNIVIMVIGSQGDIQPFLKLDKNLKEFGHRVRIATHPAFKDFVQKDSGLEFFSVGGDPAEPMAFMVKNPGMIPRMDTLKKGEVGRRRDQMAEMFEGFWRSCINATDDEKDVSNLKMMGGKAPFIADAIIANPPSFAHIHCAERLGIPLHLMFTFPYTPAQAFSHPLANIKKTNVDPGYANFMSYPLVEMMTWQGYVLLF
jgi:hypothetical protein